MRSQACWAGRRWWRPRGSATPTPAGSLRGSSRGARPGQAPVLAGHQREVSGRVRHGECQGWSRVAARGISATGSGLDGGIIGPLGGQDLEPCEGRVSVRSGSPCPPIPCWLRPTGPRAARRGGGWLPPPTAPAGRSPTDPRELADRPARTIHNPARWHRHEPLASLHPRQTRLARPHRDVANRTRPARAASDLAALPNLRTHLEPDKRIRGVARGRCIACFMSCGTTPRAKAGSPRTRICR